MSTLVDSLPVMVAGWLVLVAMYGIVRTRDLFHTVLCTSVLHAGAWLLLVGVSHTDGVAAPVVDSEVPAGAAFADPLVQALTVTDIVVGVAVTALLLSCVVRVRRRFEVLDPAELDLLRG